MGLSYWKKRRNRNRNYYDAIVDIAKIHCINAQSYIDIGNLGCEYIYEFKWIPKKYVLDINDAIYNLDGSIIKIKQDIFDWKPSIKYDLVTCLQVIEHFSDPQPLISRLIEITGKYLLISLPYLWKKGKCVNHKLDPISLDYIHNIFPFEFDVEKIITEDHGTQRFIGLKIFNKKL